MLDKELARILAEEEEIRRKDREEYPMPDFLRNAGGARGFNWAVTGESGAGKSSFVNWLLGRVLAQTGTKQTTSKPTPYEVTPVKAWDLPGAGTQDFPHKKYIASMGLRYFDLVFLVCNGRWREHDMLIYQGLKKHNVPVFVIRTKADIGIIHGQEDNPPITATATVESLLAEARVQGFASEDVYIVTTKPGKLGNFPDVQNLIDNDRLCKSIAEHQHKVRGAAASPNNSSEGGKPLLSEPGQPPSQTYAHGQRSFSSQTSAACLVPAGVHRQSGIPATRLRSGLLSIILRRAHF